MVADWDCIVRKLVRVADGRVKPGHDVGARVGIFGARYYATENIVVWAAITLDGDLVAAAQEYTGIESKSELVRVALKALVAREAARRLASTWSCAPAEIQDQVT